MLIIRYTNHGSEFTKEYKDVNAFLGAQLLEVPELQDFYEIISVTLNGEVVVLDDMTIGGLFNSLNK